MSVTIQKTMPCLWFNNQAEEAAKFYVSLFPRSKITGISRYGAAAAKATGQPVGSVLTVRFSLDGQDYLGLNGGPAFEFTEAISVVVNCETQDELDTLWRRLSEGGSEGNCGWLKDKYGLSWQLVPASLSEMINDKDQARSDRVMEAVMTMNKLDIEGMKRAYREPKSQEG